MNWIKLHRGEAEIWVCFELQIEMYSINRQTQVVKMDIGRIYDDTPEQIMAMTAQKPSTEFVDAVRELIRQSVELEYAPCCFKLPDGFNKACDTVEKLLEDMK